MPGEMKLLTVREVAKRLRRSVGRTYVLLARGDVPSVKVGGSIRVLAADLDHYIESQRRKSA